MSRTYITWTSIRRGAKHRKPLFHTTRMSRVMGYFSAPPGSIVFLKKTIALVLTILYKISRLFGTTNLSLWTKIVWFYIFIFWLNNTYLNSTKKRKRSRDISWRHKLVFRDSAQLDFFFKCLFSFNFRRSICLICNLNSEGNLTRKHLNLEFSSEGGFQALFYRFIQIQTTISQVIYEILQKKKSVFNSLFSDLSEKKNKKQKTKNWEIQKFKIYVKMRSANMTS